MTRERRLTLLKTLPGFAISAFFLWYTFRGFKFETLRGVKLASPWWLVAVLATSIAGYTLRCYRWWLMLRGVRARFADCARIFMTSLAANNILPLRIGDVMRIFTYSGDLNATPSIVLSTVILEKLLDVFTLALMFVVTMHFGKGVPPRVHALAQAGVAISTIGLLVLVFGARTLEEPLKKMFARTKNPLAAKVEHWLMLAIECIRDIGVAGTLGLVLVSLVAWGFEGLLYVSATRAIHLPVDMIGPWQAVAEANLSFLIPSSPGGIGPFELACKDALMRHGTPEAAAALFGLGIHAWLFLTITGTGGAMFLLHRYRRAMRKPLFEEIETLPPALP